MKRYFSFLLVSILLTGLFLASCQTGINPVIPTATSAPQIVFPTATSLPLLIPETSKLEFRDMSVRVSEGDPPKAIVSITGNQPDACTELKTAYYLSGTNEFEVSVLGEKPQGVLCAQVITPFTIDVEIDLKDASGGEYQVKLGELRRTFNLKGGAKTATPAISCPPRLPGTNLFESEGGKDTPDYCFLFPFGFTSQEMDNGRHVILTGPSRSFSTGTVVVKLDLVTKKIEAIQPIDQLVSDQLVRSGAATRNLTYGVTFAGSPDALMAEYKLKDVKFKTYYLLKDGWLYAFTLTPEDFNSAQVQNELRSLRELLEKSFTILDP